jgi:vacuolar-type H+-ATPase subunit I/STV1
MSEEKDRIINPEIPKTLEEAQKIAKSLVSWMEYIKTDPLKLGDAMSSFGGHIEEHLAVLQVWFQLEKINALQKAIERGI